MNIERLKIADLKPAERNTRIHNRKQIEELIRSFKMFGQIRPVIIDENNVIWCGNGFFEAVKEAGETEIDAYRVVGLTEDQKKKLMLADNQTFLLGATNSVVMDEILAELSDFDVPGYDAATLEQLFGDIEEAVDTLSSYGVVEEEAVQAISKAEEMRNNEQEQRVVTRYEQREEADSEDESLPPTVESANGMLNVPKDEGARPFIICPRCGEKIWV